MVMHLHSELELYTPNPGLRQFAQQRALFAGMLEMNFIKILHGREKFVKWRWEGEN